jgi:restriction endonuclease S subunit
MWKQLYQFNGSTKLNIQQYLSQSVIGQAFPRNVSFQVASYRLYIPDSHLILAYVTHIVKILTYKKLCNETQEYRTNRSVSIIRGFS